MSDLVEQATVSGAGPASAGHPPFLKLLMFFGVAAFAGAAAVGLRFADALGRAVPVVVASAVVFAVGTTAALRSPARRVSIVAAGLVCLAGFGAASAAGRQYDESRRRVFGGREGVRLVEPGSDDGRRMGAAMLLSITSSLGAITAVPLAGYFAVRVTRTRHPL